MGAARQTKEGSVMPEEKGSLPPVKEFLEQMYGVKLEEPTPEELEEVGRRMEEAARRMKAEGLPPLPPGHEDV